MRRVFSNQVHETRRTITLNGLSAEVCLREISVIDQICCLCHFVSRTKCTFSYLSVCLSILSGQLSFRIRYATSCLSSFPSVFVVVLYTAKKRKSPYPSIYQVCWWNGSIFLRKWNNEIMREDSSGWDRASMWSSAFICLRMNLVVTSAVVDISLVFCLPVKHWSCRESDEEKNTWCLYQ